MSTVVFGWPVFSDASVLYTPSLSAGSWSTDLPLTNLQTRFLAEVARSSDALAASTQFQVDLGVARQVRVIALPKHNLTTAATIRVRAHTSASFGSPTYDSGTVNAYLDATLTAEQLNGINHPVVIVPSAAQNLRYWLIELTDTANPDGYVELGRLVLAGGWQPTVNMQVGASLEVEDDSERSVSWGGVAHFDVRTNRRIQRFTLPEASESEALTNGFDMQRLAGTHGQLFFVFDPDDTTHMHRRAMLCTMRRLAPFEMQDVLSRYWSAWELEEVL